MASTDPIHELIRTLRAELGEARRELRRHGEALAALEHHQAIGAVRMAGALGTLADIRGDVMHIRKILDRRGGGG